MLLSFFDKKLTSAYIRLVNHWHPTPPMAEDYAPATTTDRALPVVDYVRQLVDGYGRIHILQKNAPHPQDHAPVDQYRIDQLYVTDAYHMKQTGSPGHEYVVLVVNVGDIETFYLRVERTWNQPGSLSHLPSDAMDDFRGSLSDDNRLKLGPPSRTPSTPKPRRTSTADPAADKFNTSFARSSELMASSSPDAYAAGPANDTVLLASHKDVQATKSTIVIEHITFKKLPFNPQVLPLIQAIGMAAAVSRKFAMYTLFNHQCFFYAATLMDCFKRSAEQAGERARVLESTDVERGTETVSLDGDDKTQDPPQDSAAWRRWGKKSPKGGRFLVIPIFEFREKAFDGVTWPACEEYCARLTRQLHEITRSDREKEARIEALQRKVEELERMYGVSHSKAVESGAASASGDSPPAIH